MNRIVTASIATLAITSSAYAADINAPAAVPYSYSYSWTGFYAGADVGADWSKSSGAWNPLDANGVLDPAYWGVNPLSGGLSGTGAVAGGHLGYNFQVSSIVLGIEGDWTWSNVKDSWTQHWTETIPSEGLRPGTHSSVSTAVDSIASIRARAGYLVMPSMLLYSTGGFAWADVSYDDQAQNEMGKNPLHSTPYSASYSASKWVGGWVVGGGLEYALSHNWSLRGEYLFYRLNTANSVTVGDSTGHFCAMGCPGVPFPSNFTRSDTDVQAVRIGAGYKF